MSPFFPVSLVVTTLLIILSSLTLASSASEDIKVTVYKGPKKCSNPKPGGDKDEEKPTKIEQDYTAAFHFTVTVDESSTGKNDVIGKKIESSYDVGFAPSFPVGQGKVIAGLDRGLIGLCKGSSAYIVIPPHLAYGRYGKPQQGVYGDTTLRYDVEIIDVQPPIPNDFIKIDANKDWKISKKEAQKYFSGLGQPIDLDSLFKEEDKDGDGYISWHEFSGPKGGEEPPKKPTEQELKQRRMQREQMQQQQQQQQQQRQKEQIDIASIVQGIDTDKDGKISKDELAATFKALGHDLTDEFWHESDPDGDGYITFEEFAGTVGGDNNEGRGEEL